MQEEGRLVLFKSLIGSHNYKLNRVGSDKDYKVYLAPTFDDLYDGVRYAKQTVGVDVDHAYHDIRKLPELLFKSNINFVEGLFSDEMYIDEENHSLILELLKKKDEIARINLPYLFQACRGMHVKKMAMLEKGTEGTQHLVDKYGYDTKQGQHAYRALDFLERFANTEFSDFKSAIEYNNEEKIAMHEIKDGKYNLEDFRKIAEEKLEKVMEILPIFNAYNIDTETNERVKELVKELVRVNLKLENTNV